MASETDLESLFGDGGDGSDVDSLFGTSFCLTAEDEALEAELAAMLADDGGLSNFITEQAEESALVSQPGVTPTLSQIASAPQPPSSETPERRSLLTLPQAAQSGLALSLPMSPFSLLALPMATDVFEDGQTREPTVASPLTLPCRPVSQSSHSSRTSQLTLPTLPDPPFVSLSRQDGHTSGTYVVSPQYLTCTSPVPSCQDSVVDAEPEALLDYETLEDQNVNDQESLSPPHLGDHAGLGPGLNQILIPGNRYANTETRRNQLVPRRIDYEGARVDAIVPFLFFKNSEKLESLYRRLELNLAEGKSISRALKGYLRGSPFAVLIGEQSTGFSNEGKHHLGKTALHILKAEGWGEGWFGRHSATAANRTQFWPFESTLITINFCALLHRAIRIEKQVIRTRTKRTAGDKWDLDSIASSVSSADSTSLVASHPAAALEVPAVGSQETSPDGLVLLDVLVRQVKSNKRKASEAEASPSETPLCVEVPADADLTYRVYVKDKTSGQDLSPPTIYRHSNQLLACGAYKYLTSSFASAGYSSIVMIHTANQTKWINNEEDWESAVREIYWWRTRGGIVEVDILV